MSLHIVSTSDSVGPWQRIVLAVWQALVRVNQWRRNSAESAYNVRPRCCRAEYFGASE